MQRKAGRGLLVVKIDIKPAHEEEMNRWYEEEHLPDRANCPGFISARRYVVVRGDPVKYFAIYDLDSPAVLNSDAYKRIALTPWTEKLRTFYASPAFRGVYEEVAPAANSGSPAESRPDGRTDTRGLLVEWVDPNAGREGDLNRWYEAEHLSAQAKRPGFLSARRFAKVEGAGARCLAVYELERPDAAAADDDARWAGHIAKELGGTAARTLYREVAGAPA